MAQERMVARTNPATNRGHRPLRFVSAIMLAVGTISVMSLAATWLPADSSFVGGTAQQPLRSSTTDDSAVVMQIKSGRWQAGMPNNQEIARRRVSFPSLSNMKDQYFILWVRSSKIRFWHPLNIVSGSEAAKNLKNLANSDVAKAVGGDKLADYQVVKAIGMNLYKDKENVQKQALQMHPKLNWAKDLEYGYKEISNNTEFNKNPGPFLSLVNISAIPPEDELRNLLDDAGDAIGDAGTKISKVGDNVKGFFSGIGS